MYVALNGVYATSARYIGGGRDAGIIERTFDFLLNGAGDRFRTDDLVLGKHALYQLSYTRSPKR